MNLGENLLKILMFSNNLFFKINSKPEWEKSMRSLILLLKDKEFLLSFVRTLEGQSGFQMNDR